MLTLSKCCSDVLYCLQSGISVFSVNTLWFTLKIHLLWLDAVKNLLKCNCSVFDAIQVDEHQETLEKRKQEKTLTLKTHYYQQTVTMSWLLITMTPETESFLLWELKTHVGSHWHRWISVMTELTLDELGGFGALKPLEEQNVDLFPVLNDWFPGKRKK